MFLPNFTITNSVLKNIAVCEAAKEIILSYHLSQIWENKIKRESQERTIFFNSRLEGNRLTEDEISQILDGKFSDDGSLDIQEVVNLRFTLKYIDEISQNKNARDFTLSAGILLDLHKLITKNILPEAAGSNFRVKQVIVRNADTGEISYTPPPAAEVPYLVEDLINWLNSEDSRETHPVIRAALAQVEIYRIHPFATGTNQVARMFSNLILKLGNFSVKDFLSLEEFFDENLKDYHTILQSVCNLEVIDNFERDLTPWVEFYCFGAAIEMNKLRDLIKKVSADSKAKDAIGEVVNLTERQVIIMDYLHRHKQMLNKDFRKIFPDFSDDTVLREIKFLKKKGLVKKVGNTKKAMYVATDLE